MKLLLLPAATLMIVFGVINISNPAVSAEQSSEPQELFVKDSSEWSIDVSAYGVFDMETGEILLGNREDEELPIASITKIFTASAVIDSGMTEDLVTITYDDVATEGRAGKLLPGQVYKVRDLLFPLLLESSNDAATALERVVGKIPLGDRLLADASGLSDKNTATVSELAKEVSHVYRDAPFVFDVTKLKQNIGEQTGWINNSPVRDLPGYQGGKHGYTEAANRTLVAVFAEPSIGGRELGYVILGSKDLLIDLAELRSVVSNSVVLQ